VSGDGGGGDNQLDRQRILNALHLTYERRGPPPFASQPEWQTPFWPLAEACGLQRDLAMVFERVQEFLEKVLAYHMEQ
jgi:hypothetical protein